METEEILELNTFKTRKATLSFIFQGCRCESDIAMEGHLKLRLQSLEGFLKSIFKILSKIF